MLDGLAVGAVTSFQVAVTGFLDGCRVRMVDVAVDEPVENLRRRVEILAGFPVKALWSRGKPLDPQAALNGFHGELGGVSVHIATGGLLGGMEGSNDEPAPSSTYCVLLIRWRYLCLCFVGIAGFFEGLELRETRVLKQVIHKLDEQAYVPKSFQGKSEERIYAIIRSLDVPMLDGTLESIVSHILERRAPPPGMCAWLSPCPSPGPSPSILSCPWSLVVVSLSPCSRPSSFVLVLVLVLVFVPLFFFFPFETFRRRC